MSVDVIGNFLTIIRNGIMRSKPFVEDSFSNLKLQLVKILQEEGYISSFEILGEGVQKKIKVVLKYVGGESVIHEITRVSKPSRRVYSGFDKIKPVIGGLGVSILTTNKGLLTDKVAKQMSVGGEVICTVW